VIAFETFLAGASVGERTMLPASKARHWHALELAKQAVELGGRLSIVSTFTGLGKTELRQLFCDPDAARRHSGRQPTNWDLSRSVVVEVQAAMFYACFRAIRQLGYPAADALVTGFKHYLRHFGHDPRLTFDRAFELVAQIEGCWTARAPSLMTVVCHHCKSRYLIPRAAEPVGSGECPFCRLARMPKSRIPKAVCAPNGLTAFD